MVEPLTSDTITDDQIRELWSAKAVDMHTACYAIHGGSLFRVGARAHCAEIFNARKPCYCGTDNITVRCPQHEEDE